MNVVNVHAPSGSQQLTDAKRRQLVKNMLHINSLVHKRTTLGYASERPVEIPLHVTDSVVDAASN